MKPLTRRDVSNPEAHNADAGTRTQRGALIEDCGSRCPYMPFHGQVVALPDAPAEHPSIPVSRKVTIGRWHAK